MSTQRPELQAREILRHLTEAGVDFVVIGGIAAVLHGSARMTFDLDICFDTDPVNLDVLGRVLVDLECRLKGVSDEVPFLPDGKTLRNVEVLTMVSRLGELDVLARPAGAPGYDTLRKRAERFDLDGFLVRVASIPDLVMMKRAADRDKDRADVVELEAIARERGVG